MKRNRSMWHNFLDSHDTHGWLIAAVLLRPSCGPLAALEGERAHQICSFMCADNFWIMSPSKENLEQMLRDLLDEASRWDLVPKPVSLWCV